MMLSAAGMLIGILALGFLFGIFVLFFVALWKKKHGVAVACGLMLSLPLLLMFLWFSYRSVPTSPATNAGLTPQSAATNAALTPPIDNPPIDIPPPIDNLSLIHI